MVVTIWLSQIFFAHLCIFKNAKKKPAFKKKWMMIFDVWCLPLVMASSTELTEKSGNGAIWVAMDCFTIRPHSFSPKRFWNCHTRVKVSCHVRKSLFRWTFNSFGKFLPEKCIQNWCFFSLSSTWKENKQNLRNSDIKEILLKYKGNSPWLPNAVSQRAFRCFLKLFLTLVLK